MLSAICSALIVIVPLPASMEKIARPSMRSLVFEQLRTLIETGGLGPGEVIRDYEVARRLGVSRTPVREALQRLEQQGAVEALPGRVTRVVDLSRDDAPLVYAPLSALEELAAEVATPLATKEDL